MLIEYVVFLTLAFAAIVAAVAGMRRRRRDVASADSPFPLFGEGASSVSDDVPHQTAAPHDAPSHGGFDSGGGSSADGSSAGGGGHSH